MKKLKWIGGAIIIFCLISFFYLRLPETLVYNFSPKTNIESGRLIVAKTGESTGSTLVYGLTSPNGSELISSKILALVDINNKSITETIIERLTGESTIFYSAIIVNNNIFYLMNNKGDVKMINYDIKTKEKQTIDVLSQGFLLPQKLLYDSKNNKIIWYQGDAVKKFDASQPEIVQNVKLWDIVKAQSRGGFLLSPGSQKILSGDYFVGTNPMLVEIIDGSLFTVFENLHSIKNEYENESVCTYPPDVSSISSLTIPIKCDISTDYKCSVECPNTEVFTRLNQSYHLQGGGDVEYVTGRGENLAMTNSDEFIFTAPIHDLLDINCGGGYFQMGSCLHYEIDSLRKINSNETKDVYKKGGSGWNIKNIVPSADKKYVAYSDSGDTYVLSLSGNNKPTFLIKNAFPFYFETEK